MVHLYYEYSLDVSSGNSAGQISPNYIINLPTINFLLTDNRARPPNSQSKRS